MQGRGSLIFLGQPISSQVLFEKSSQVLSEKVSKEKSIAFLKDRVKTQARSQNNRSRALKLGIVCLYVTIAQIVLNILENI